PGRGRTRDAPAGPRERVVQDDVQGRVGPVVDNGDVVGRLLAGADGRRAGGLLHRQVGMLDVVRDGFAVPGGIILDGVVVERPAGQIDGRHRRPRAKGGGAHPGAGGDRLLV